MAWYPPAIKKNINPGPNDPPIKVVGAILHVDSGDSKSLFNYFKNDSGGIESHFFVLKDGNVEQYRDTGYEADANLKANSFFSKLYPGRAGFVSIETQGKDRGEWTPQQLAAIRALLLWLSATHDFPLRKCDNPQGPGVGYHTMFGAPGPWTPVAKDCPGPDRIRQFNSVLVPWFDTFHAPSGGVIETPGKEVTVEEVLAAVRALADAETKRYADLANKLKSEARISLARYVEFHDTLARIEGLEATEEKDTAA